MRPLPSPPIECDRFSGSENVAPPSVERAKKISPPCEPPENTISCHTTNTSRGDTTMRGSHEKIAGLREMLIAGRCVPPKI